MKKLSNKVDTQFDMLWDSNIQCKQKQYWDEVPNNQDVSSQGVDFCGNFCARRKRLKRLQDILKRNLKKLQIVFVIKKADVITKTGVAEYCYKRVPMWSKFFLQMFLQEHLYFFKWDSLWFPFFQSYLYFLTTKLSTSCYNNSHSKEFCYEKVQMFFIKTKNSQKFQSLRRFIVAKFFSFNFLFFPKQNHFGVGYFLSTSLSSRICCLRSSESK